MASDKKPKKPEKDAPKKAGKSGGHGLLWWLGFLLFFSFALYLGGYLTLRWTGGIAMPTRHDARAQGGVATFFGPGIWCERQLRGLGTAAGSAAEQGGKALRESVQ